MAASGQIVNHRKRSSEIGVAHTIIAGYYQILKDCLIAERIEPLSVSATRKKRAAGRSEQRRAAAVDARGDANLPLE